MSTEGNGHFDTLSAKFREAIRAEIEGQTSELTKALDTGFKNLNKSMDRIGESLLSAAIGKEHVPYKIAMPLIRTLCAVIVSLVVWFTGIEPNLPNQSKYTTVEKH